MLLIKLILKEKVNNLGNLGDCVYVKAGYARNYLIPSKKAMLAISKNIEFFEKQRQELELLEKQKIEEAELLNIKLEKLKSINIVVKTIENNNKKIFGSINAKNIADTISKYNIIISPKQVCLPNGNLRQLGEYEIIIKLYANIKSILTINIIK